MRCVQICLLLFTSLLTFSCSPEASKGYNNIEELYRESAKALQTKDSIAIRDFVEKAFPDDGTADYMYANNYHYRGFPDVLKDRPRLVDSMRTIYTQRFYHLAISLEERGLLAKLRFVGFDRTPITDTISQMPITEPIGKYVSGNDTIEYKIGELLKVNNVWKSFTNPKL